MNTTVDFADRDTSGSIACQLPPALLNKPSRPGRLQVPETSTEPPGTAAVPVRPVSPQRRPPGVAASARNVTSDAQFFAAVFATPAADSSTSVGVTATSRPSASTARVSGSAARPAGSSP